MTKTVFICKWVNKDGTVYYLKGRGHWTDNLSKAKAYSKKNHASAGITNWWEYANYSAIRSGAKPTHWRDSGEDIKILEGTMTFQEV